MPNKSLTLSICTPLILHLSSSFHNIAHFQTLNSELFFSCFPSTLIFAPLLAPSSCSSRLSLPDLLFYSLHNHSIPISIHHIIWDHFHKWASIATSFTFSMHLYRFFQLHIANYKQYLYSPFIQDSPFYLYTVEQSQQPSNSLSTTPFAGPTYHELVPPHLNQLLVLIFMGYFTILELFHSLTFYLCLLAFLQNNCNYPLYYHQATCI